MLPRFGALRGRQPSQLASRRDDFQGATWLGVAQRAAGSARPGDRAQSKTRLDLARSPLARSAGWEVLARLKASEPTRDIPVVVISADATSKQVKRLMALGAKDYLTKPIDVPQLIKTLDRHVPACQLS